MTFWSEQAGVRVQVAGTFRHTQQCVRRVGASGGVTLLHLDEGRLAAVEAVDAARDYRAAHRLLPTAPPMDVDRLGDHRQRIEDCVARRTPEFS